MEVRNEKRFRVVSLWPEGRVHEDVNYEGNSHSVN